MRSTPRLKRLISTVTGMLRDREAEGMELLGSVIKELGTVVDDGISAEQLIVEMSNYHHQINQAYSFKVILVDMKGNKVSSKMLRQSIKSLAVEMAGSSNVKVSTFQPEKEVISFPFISILDLIDHH